MKKLLLVLLMFVFSCSKSVSDEELMKKAEDFCSCHDGVWYVHRIGESGMFQIKCNAGENVVLDEKAVVKRLCK